MKVCFECVVEMRRTRESMCKQILNVATKGITWSVLEREEKFCFCVYLVLLK